MFAPLPTCAVLSDNGVMTMLDNIRRRWRSAGVAMTAFFLFRRLMMALSFRTVVLQFFYLFVQPVRATPLLSERMRSGLIIRPLDPSEAQKATFVDPLSVVTERLERGDICLAAFRSDNLVGYIWLHFGPFKDTTSRCYFIPTPPDRVSWDLDIYIVMSERGGVVLVALWDAANELLRSKGCDWTASWISAFNGPSLRAHERLGARRVGTVVFLRLGFFQITAVTPRPFIHISFDPDRIPTIAVSAPDGADGE